MEAKTLTMYTKILKDRKTLKADVEDVIEVVKSSADLAGYNSQHGDNIVEALEKAAKVVKGKIIIKKYSIKNRTTDILYWSCCDMDDFVAMSGYTNYSNGSYNTVNRVEREDKVSFLGKDIITSLKAVPDDTDNKFIKGMKENYLNTEHPLSDRIFYSISFSYKNQRLTCYRDLDLSPRPSQTENKAN